MTFRSCLYAGSVMHRRLYPRPHHFRYSAFWTLLDLDELERLSENVSCFSYNRFNLFSFHNADHGDGSPVPLRRQIEQKLLARGIDLEGGRIELLCIPRMLGYCFNPLSIFFCYRGDTTLVALIHEVHNTFGERHTYIMPVEQRGGLLHQRCQKLFHVSPFLDMDMRYDFRIVRPDERMCVAISASSPDRPVLNAVMSGKRRALSDRSLLRLFVGIPALTFKVIVAIHWEALRLWLKRTRFHSHPGAHSATASE
jgi:DUF1365 family protein